MQIDVHSRFSVALYPAGATFGPRRLRDWEFVWVVEGNTVYTHNGESFDAPEGSLVLCRPPATDGFRWDTHRRTRHAYFHFALTGPLPPTWPALDDWPIVRLANGDLLATLFQHLLAWGDSGDPYQTKLITQALLSAFVTGQTAGGAVRRDALPPPVEAASAYITRCLDENPAAHVRLAELARAACVSPEHLCRVFKRATGHSPAQTVLLARLDRAVSLLARTNFAIGEIAAMCGFESPFHFSRRVRDAYGLSPRALRRAFADGTPPPTTRLLRQETVLRSTFADGSDGTQTARERPKSVQ